MPAAFYEFTIEQSSNFSSALKVLNPNTGRLFKFIPTEETTALTQPWINNNTQLSFDVPDEIKLVYPNDSDSFGWLKGTDVPKDPVTEQPTDPSFLTIRMKVKSSSGALIFNTFTTYSKTILNNNIPAIRLDTASSRTSTNPFFEIRRNSPDHNILMKILSTQTESYSGKYLYDIELQYRLGSSTSSLTPFVLRLLQGRMVFNKNITTP